MIMKRKKRPGPTGAVEPMKKKTFCNIVTAGLFQRVVKI
jgi:hypothetical protein